MGKVEGIEAVLYLAGSLVVVPGGGMILADTITANYFMPMAKPIIGFAMCMWSAVVFARIMSTEKILNYERGRNGGQEYEPDFLVKAMLFFTMTALPVMFGGYLMLAYNAGVR